MKSFALNLLIAVIWLLLQRDRSPADFVIGFILGFALVAVFGAIFGNEGYVRRSVALVQFVVLFTWEFLSANASVAGTVLFRTRESLHPNFLTYDVSGLTHMEILLLAYSISLTPGTTTVDVTEDRKGLIIHALDADEPDAIRADIDRALKQRILAFTR